jgi:hypothetical protein
VLGSLSFSPQRISAGLPTARALLDNPISLRIRDQMAAAAVATPEIVLVAKAPSSPIAAVLAPAASPSRTRGEFDEKCGAAFAEVVAQLTSIYSGNGSWSRHLTRDISRLSHLLSGRLTPAAVLVQWRSSSEGEATIQPDDVVPMLGLREWNPPNLSAQIASIPSIDEDGAHEQCMDSYEFLLEMLTDVLAERDAYVSLFRQSALEGDWIVFRHKAHGLFGLGMNLHLPAFANVANRMARLGIMALRKQKEPDRDRPDAVDDKFRWRDQFSSQEWNIIRAMSDEQNTQLDSLLRAAQAPLIAQLDAQYDRLASYLPRLRDLREVEQMVLADLEHARDIPSWAGA